MLLEYQVDFWLLRLAVDEEATPNSQICVDGHILSSTEPKRHTDLQKTGTGEGRNAQTTNSDSPSHDSVVSLDMAAIVQSFVTEQQAVLNDMPPLDLYRLQQQPGIPPTSQQIYSGDPYAQQWGMLDMTGNQLLDDDALFGKFDVMYNSCSYLTKDRIQRSCIWWCLAVNLKFQRSRQPFH